MHLFVRWITSYIKKIQVCVSSVSFLSHLLSSDTFFGGFFPSSTDSRRASCQLLTKEWALYTGKPLGLPLNSEVK